MASVPGNINSVGGNFRGIQPGAGYGGDNGEGFHSTQPVSLERNDDTENLHNRNRLQEGDAISADPIATFPKYSESPFTRYVSRPLSSGTLSDSLRNFAPEDRSKTGVPLNPFWIRNDLWSMANEADIFLDASPNWVAPRVNVNGAQSKQGFTRETYLDNQEQPQKSNEQAPIAVDVQAPPKQEAAGTVSGPAAVEDTSNMEMKDANPAKVKTGEESEAKETDMKEKTEETPQTASSEKPPPKKRSRKEKPK
jgi:hypothetical protein